MAPVWLLTTAIFAPLVCGLVSLIVPRRIIGLRVAIALAGPMVAIWLIGSHIATHGTGSIPPAVEWMPTVKLELALNPDKLGLFFALLVACIGLLIVLYARAYFGPDRDSLYRFYPTLLLFMTAMLGVALSDNFMLMLLFWEMTSISSFLLIGWERDDPAAVKKAMQAFVTTAMGGLAMMGGLILLGAHTGQWTYSGLLEQGVHGDGLTTTAFVLIFIGAMAKSAQFPLHFWLPGAMAAPTPVSAYLHSATMVKAGVYLTGRLWPILAAAVPLWPKLIIPIGAITMVYGAYIALRKEDLKQIFAYTTVSQLGLLICMYGLSAYNFVAHHATGSGAEHIGAHGEHGAEGLAAALGQPNLIWDVTQILNHAFYKAPLFILAGAIGHVASRQLPELRGFFWRDRTSRIMTTVLLAAAFALAAFPGTLSFTAKEFFFYQIYHGYEATHSAWFWPLFAAGIATGMFNVAIFTRLFTTLTARPEIHTHVHEAAHGHGNGNGHAHTGHAHAHDGHSHETGLWPAFLWIPGAVIVAFQFICGLVPGAYELLFGWLEPSKYYFEHFPMIPSFSTPPVYMSLACVVLGMGLGLSPVLRKIYADPFDHLYPGFYTGVTKKLGPWAFGLVQRGHAGFYVGAVTLGIFALFAWAVSFHPELIRWPTGAVLEPVGDLLPGYLIVTIVAVATVLMPIVKDRAARVLVLGTAGFSVTAVYYLYQAPDLALTQISIEIVSLILFLLVLSLLPDRKVGKPIYVPIRLLIAAAIGIASFWLTLTSSVGHQPTMPYTTREGVNLANLGEYFLRNSYHSQDTLEVEPEQVYGGVVDRGVAHRTGYGTPGSSHEDAPETRGDPSVTLHKGGGGANVVNVILVDFRGFDTMGEITVLGLAAMGVWTLLRRHPRKGNHQASQPNKSVERNDPSEDPEDDRELVTEGSPT